MPDTPLLEIADIFEDHHIKRVPVVIKGGELVGLVSRANIIQAIAGARPKLEISLPDTAIRTKLMEEDRKHQPWTNVHKINVTVTNGVVDLWGFVGSDKERQAIKIATEAPPRLNAVNDHLVREELAAAVSISDARPL